MATGSARSCSAARRPAGADASPAPERVGCWRRRRSAPCSGRGAPSPSAHRRRGRGTRGRCPRAPRARGRARAAPGRGAGAPGAPRRPARGWAATPATVRDASDTPVVLDLQSASLTTRGSRLEAKVSFYDDWSAADLLASSGPPGSICLDLWTKRTPGQDSPDFLGCATARTATRITASVLKDTGDGLPARADSATVSVSGRTLTLRFRPAAIGSPRRLRFAAEATQALGCKRPRGCVDRAPNGSRTGHVALG